MVHLSPKPCHYLQQKTSHLDSLTPEYPRIENEGQYYHNQVHLLRKGGTQLNTKIESGAVVLDIHLVYY